MITTLTEVRSVGGQPRYVCRGGTWRWEGDDVGRADSEVVIGDLCSPVTVFREPVEM